MSRISPTTPALAHLQVSDTANRRAIGAIREKSSDGSAYSALSSVVCKSVIFTNTSGADFLVRRGGSGPAITIPDGTGKAMDVSANANELQVKRADAGDSVTMQYECAGEVV